MIRSPLGLRLDPSRPIKEQIRGAASAGARGVIVDAAGDLAPDRLSETGRREFRQMLRSVELDLIALNLPTRRPFDNLEQLEDRLSRAERAFSLAYELGTRLVLARVGGLPPEDDASRRVAFTTALRELGRRADHRGVRFAIETGTEPGGILGTFLDQLEIPSLCVSLDPSSLLRQGIDPVAATRELGAWVAHAYANDASRSSRSPTLANPRGMGFPAGALDWEEYLGALEEINYRGFLTVWPETDRDPTTQFREMAERLRRF
ncbi:sugar phosphate isomerase/epimerase family protein [Tundrisphaera lichenicola]|uniref:sugar phosphate isomerase/epimerase family protein n=1 Tax=Tundrisphaera lichenicola TaxID=2029860 RepID=UPI003EB832E9